MRSLLKTVTLYVLPVLCTVWLVVGTIVVYQTQKTNVRVMESTDSIANMRDEYNNQTHEDIFAELVMQDTNIKSLEFELDKLKGKVEIVDAAVHGRDKRKARIVKAIAVIKETLPPGGNYLPGCPRAPSPGELWSIAGAIIDNADEYAVSASLIAGVIRQESAFCNLAVSRAGARGYMQLMPDTAAEISADVAVKTRRTLRTWRGDDNIQMGTAYLSQMILEFDGDIALAVKAYNAGPIHIKRVQAGERTLYAETENYVRKVLKYKEEYERLGLQ